MNREIKFRAWNGDTMNYSIMAGKFGAFWINAGKNNDGFDENDKSSLTQFNTKCSETTKIMQFTGLHDNNGKEIYEGDVCQITMHHNYGHAIDNKKVIVGAVEFGKISINDDFLNTYNCFHINNRSIEFLLSQELEVIGNIYENPELLKN